MILLLEFGLPFKEPVLVFSTVLLVILFSPLVFNRMGIPGIIGLILSGVILGPNGFHVLERDSSIVLFGTVGLLYLMFIAGLEINMNDFKKNKNKSLVFGALTFIVPLILGWLGSHYILGYSPRASLLLASMFSTHTLITYPIVSKLGISQKLPVTITIGGTIITDAAVLIILAIVTNLQKGELTLFLWLKLFVSLAVFTFLILWGVPRLSKWFFRNLEAEGNAQYLFVLSMVFLSGFLAHLAGFEPIIGAFLSGLALNTQIPHTSSLMNRIDFVGNTIFIPFFLISVGMLVDIGVLLKGPEALLTSVVIIIISFAGKWGAAFLTQQIYGFSTGERRLIWGMSSSHAAATIAVVIIGFNIKLLDENTLNASVLLILVSCLASSLIVEKSGRKIAIESEAEVPTISEMDQRILVPISDTENMSRLLDFAFMIKDPKSTEPVRPLIVVKEEAGAEKQLWLNNQKMEEALKEYIKEHANSSAVNRMDVNVGNGIIRATKELAVTDIIMGWNGKITREQRVFGNIIDKVINSTPVQILFCKFCVPVNTIKNIVAVFPKNAEHEAGYHKTLKTIVQFAAIAGAGIELYATSVTNEVFKREIKDQGLTAEIRHFPFKYEELSTLTRQRTLDDLFIVVLARPQTISHNSFMSKVPRYLSKNFADLSFIALYPEQNWDRA